MCRRHNDFAVLSVATAGNRDVSGRWRDVVIGLGGVADRPVLATRAAALLNGSSLSDQDIARAAEAALDVIDPPSDIRASAEYRRHLVPIFVRRVLGQMGQP
jgi:carbon-monoxide dehydrogenase medium subunit